MCTIGPPHPRPQRHHIRGAATQTGSGQRGLGFAVGVAINLLPALRRSGQAAWYSLRMRGGLRAQWWRGIQLLLVTILMNGLRQAENVALAAEARAFTPERAVALPVKRGGYDWYLAAALLLVWLLVGWAGYG